MIGYGESSGFGDDIEIREYLMPHIWFSIVGGCNYDITNHAR